MRQLFPAAIDPVEPEHVYADVPVRDDRPSVRLNMIASVDGATSVDGLSGALGGPADRRVFMALRSFADIVLVAAGTVRAEGYGPAELAAPAQEARRRRGQTAVPAIAVVSRRCNLDWNGPFFRDAAVKPIVLTVTEAPAHQLDRANEVAEVVIAGDRTVDLRRALTSLREHDVGAVLAEGGPSLNAQLAGTGLLDELCLTVSPSMVGGDAKRIVTGPAIDPTRDLKLSAVCEEDGYLFLRYRASDMP
jgi:riboflavin biosynthesis pyrimidine reductase